MTFSRAEDFWDPLELVHRARASSAQSAWSMLDAVVTRAGFVQSFYAYGVPMTSQQPLQEKFKRGIFGGGRFVNEFLPELARRPDLLATEPVSPHCKQSLHPFVWSRTDMKARDTSALGFASEFGLGSFVVFPLRSADGNQYGNFTIHCNDARPEVWLRHARQLGPLLHVTAQYFHDSIAGDDAADGLDVSLSPRQRECLLWASRGLSTKQIAERTGLSGSVVHEYLGVAKRRLGCATRAHAVARAMRLGLIQP
jgi:DNA-binding CsgD family transcriptional regulator